MTSTPYMTPTMTALAHAPDQAELNRLSISGIVEACFHPSRLRGMKGRHERLANKHSNAGDAARAGDPTPPVGSSPGKVCKLAFRAAKETHRQEGRAMRLRQIRTSGAGPVLTTKYDEQQRERCLRGQHREAVPA